MRNLSLLALGFFLFMNPLLGAVFTKTHAYILSGEEGKILVIDRKTNEEKILDVHRDFYSMQIYKDKGFVCGLEYRTLYIIDLLKNEVSDKIDLPFNYPIMTIHGKYGYVGFRANKNLIIIDLETCKILKNIPLHMHAVRMNIYKDEMYIWELMSGIITTLDLVEHRVLHSYSFEPGYVRNVVINGDLAYVFFGGGKFFGIINLLKDESTKVCFELYAPDMHPHAIAFYKNKGYVSNLENNSIWVIDSSDDPKCLKKIETDEKTQRLVPHGNYGYVICKRGFSLKVIDLERDEVVETFSVPCSYAFVISGDRGFCVSEQELIIVDLKTQKICKKIDTGVSAKSYIKWNDLVFVKERFDRWIVFSLLTSGKVLEIKNEKGADLHCSDTHLYLGVTKIASLEELGLLLFDHTYNGIIGDWEGDRTALFKCFERAVASGDYVRARDYLEKAIACGDQCAFAVAAYALLFKKFGVVEDQGQWWLQFLSCAHFPYFEKLCLSGLVSVCRFSFPDEEVVGSDMPQILYRPCW